MSTDNITVRYKVFNDEKGNRFIFPGIYDQPELSVDSLSWHLCLLLHLKLESTTFDVVADENGFMNFPHIKTSVGHSRFAHGSADIWLIGGPEFDSVLDLADEEQLKIKDF